MKSKVDHIGVRNLTQQIYKIDIAKDETLEDLLFHEHIEGKITNILNIEKSSFLILTDTKDTFF